MTNIRNWTVWDWGAAIIGGSAGIAASHHGVLNINPMPIVNGIQKLFN